MSKVDPAGPGQAPSPAAGDEAFEQEVRREAAPPPPTPSPRPTAAAEERGPAQASSNGAPAGRPQAPASTPAPAAPLVTTGSPTRPDPLTADVARALAVGDDAAIEALAAPDPFAVSGRLAAATDLVVADPATDDYTAFGIATDTVARLGARTTPLAYAMHLQRMLDSAGVGDPARPLTSLAEARALAAGATGDDAYAVADALVLAQVGTGIDGGTLGLVPQDLPHRPSLAETVATGIGAAVDGVWNARDDAWRAVEPFMPTGWTLGYTYGNRMPLAGSAVLTMPIGAHGVNGPFDFTRADGTPGNTITVFARPNPRAEELSFPDPTPVSFAFGFNPELANLRDYLAGKEYPLGPNGPVQNVGVGGIVAHTATLDSAFPSNGKIPFALVSLTVRHFVDDAKQQSVAAFTLGGSLSLTEVAGGVSFAAGEVLTRVPHPATRAAGVFARAGGIAAAKLDATMREHTGVPTIGLSWAFEVRSNTASHPDGPRFDGVYKGDRRIDVLSDAWAAEAENPLLPSFPTGASLGARVAVVALDGMLEERGLVGLSDIAAAVPPEVAAAFEGVDRDVLDAWAVGEAAGLVASALPPVRTPTGDDLGGAMEFGARVGGFVGSLAGSLVERAGAAADAVMADGRPDELIDAVVSLLPPWLPGVPHRPTPLVPTP